MKSSPFFTGRAFRAFEFMPSGKCKARALPLPWLVSPVVSEGGGGAPVNRRYRSPKGDHGGHLWEQGRPARHLPHTSSPSGPWSAMFSMHRA